MPRKKQFAINGTKIAPGERKTVMLPVAELYDFTALEIPVHVIRGKKDGPVMFLSAALHGDEINGVEIIREIIKSPLVDDIKGTLIALPVVNIFGFQNKSRYLPDRRDLNRSFPGSKHGSLAGRIAHLFMREIVSKCTHGIDFHTGAIHRSNFPQIRASLDNKATMDFASSFNAPIIIDSSMRDGSLREAARSKKVNILLFEGGEALRFESDVISMGVRGTLQAMSNIGMIEDEKVENTKYESIVAKDSFWLRAPNSGTVRMGVQLGTYVKKGQVVGLILDLLGDVEIEITSPEDGIVIGVNNLPLVTLGEAILHLATVERLNKRELKKRGFIYPQADID
ncbi:MAG: succinylglutamate desuccinylase/aspartoacylase family protein [Bacteriovoracaceae bacterium]|nr:succinylglutamate desuccinylase/aspartoacylase family protein [Bacteriovoracaceae bacterium]